MLKDEEDMLELLDDGGATDQIDDLLDDKFEDELELDFDGKDDTPVQEPADAEEDGEPPLDEPGSSDTPAPEGGREFELDLRIIIIAVVAIAAIILAGIFVIMPMMSSSPPEVTITPSQQGEDINLYLVSGPALAQNELKFTLNGAEIPSDKLELIGGNTWPWRQGTSLKIDTIGYEKPGRLSVISTKGGGEYLLFSTQAEATPTPTPTPTPVPTQEPIIEPVPVSTGSSPVPVTTPIEVFSGNTQAGQGGLIQFDALPQTGREPLVVQFADQTTICAQNRTWHFGDGLTSSKRYPEHIFPFPGTYNVTLDLILCDPEEIGESAQKEITVIPIERKDTLLSGPGSAEVLAGGAMYFSVKGPGMTLRIGGKDYILNYGDQVRIEFNEGGKGAITVTRGAILQCNFENADVFVNDKELASGWLTNINIDQYDKFSTNDITIRINIRDPGVKGLVNGVPSIIASGGDVITLNNCGIDSTGKLLFNYQDQAGFTFRGGIVSFDVTPLSSS